MGMGHKRRPNQSTILIVFSTEPSHFRVTIDCTHTSMVVWTSSQWTCSCLVHGCNATPFSSVCKPCSHFQIIPWCCTHCILPLLYLTISARTRLVTPLKRNRQLGSLSNVENDENDMKSQTLPAHQSNKMKRRMVLTMLSLVNQPCILVKEEIIHLLLSSTRFSLTAHGGCDTTLLVFGLERRERETQRLSLRDSERLRETQRDSERLRETQRDSERLREASERLREAQRGSERLREAQRGSERLRKRERERPCVFNVVCGDCSGLSQKQDYVQSTTSRPQRLCQQRTPANSQSTLNSWMAGMWCLACL